MWRLAAVTPRHFSARADADFCIITVDRSMADPTEGCLRRKCSFLTCDPSMSGLVHGKEEIIR